MAFLGGAVVTTKVLKKWKKKVRESDGWRKRPPPKERRWSEVDGARTFFRHHLQREHSPLTPGLA